LRFCSTQSPEELTSFDEYVERMKAEQNGIYWISGETHDVVVKLPILEYFQRKGIEILFLIDPVSKYSFQQLKNHKLICWYC
jgi:HSP90 family molecular chaperone